MGADLLQGRPEKELASAIAKQLSYLRPEHFLRRVLTAPSQLKTVFFAALKMTNPGFSVPPSDVPEVDKIMKQVGGKLHAGHVEQLAVVVRKFAETQAEANLNKWWTTTDLTANRVGFVLCNDLEVASKMVSTEPAEIGSLPPKEKVKELVLYSVSEEYLEVRRKLGLTIEAEPMQLGQSPPSEVASRASKPSAANVGIQGTLALSPTSCRICAAEGRVSELQPHIVRCTACQKETNVSGKETHFCQHCGGKTETMRLRCPACGGVRVLIESAPMRALNKAWMFIAMVLFPIAVAIHNCLTD